MQCVLVTCVRIPMSSVIVIVIVWVWIVFGSKMCVSCVIIFLSCVNRVSGYIHRPVANLMLNNMEVLFFNFCWF